MLETLVKDIIPHNDVQRLEALRSFEILYTKAEDAFDNITQMMAGVFNAPMAFISLVDKEMVIYKSQVGPFGKDYVRREDSLCSLAILGDGPLVIEDASMGSCFQDNPYVQAQGGIRFYAGAPLVTKTGYRIGAVCVVDTKPRSFSEAERDLLIRFSKLVMHEIEVRHAALNQIHSAQEIVRTNEKLKLLSNQLKLDTERFDLVTKATQDAIWDWNLVSDELWWNDGFTELFGYKPAEVEPTIDSWYNRVHPDDKERVIAGVHAVIDHGGKNWSAEYRFLRKDGTYAIVFDRAYALHDAGGKPFRMLGAMQDITERKRLEEAAIQSEERTRLAVEAAHLGTFELDLLTQTIVYSPRAAEIFGLAAGVQWPYHTFISAIHPDDRKIRAEAHDAAKATGALLYEIRILHPDGTVRSVRLNGRYRSAGLKQLSVVGTVLDITEERKTAELLEQKIEERTRELKEVNEQLKQFTYAASHDLQEPLRKISFFIGRLLEKLGPELSEDNKQIAERIVTTSLRMRRLIDDLLAYSNTTLGVTQFVPVDLSNLIRDVLEDMEGTIIEQNAVINLHSLPPVHGDQRQLRQLFQNLISNALKYHKKGQVPEVVVSAQLLPAADVKVPGFERTGIAAYH
ncbi:MAG TPA: PAS domain-containing protein, partial [Flavisolibacter sp.]|nr:PAS domain-containing protein [Flavisolibacter sp.]